MKGELVPYLVAKQFSQPQEPEAANKSDSSDPSPDKKKGGTFAQVEIHMLRPKRTGYFLEALLNCRSPSRQSAPTDRLGFGESESLVVWTVKEWSERNGRYQSRTTGGEGFCIS